MKTLYPIQVIDQKIEIDYETQKNSDLSKPLRTH